MLGQRVDCAATGGWRPRARRPGPRSGPAGARPARAPSRWRSSTSSTCERGMRETSIESARRLDVAAWSASRRCSSRSIVDLPDPALPTTTARAGPASGDGDRVHDGSRLPLPDVERASARGTWSVSDCIVAMIGGALEDQTGIGRRRGRLGCGVGGGPRAPGSASSARAPARGSVVAPVPARGRWWVRPVRGRAVSAPGVGSVVWIGRRASGGGPWSAPGARCVVVRGVGSVSAGRRRRPVVGAPRR